MAMSRVNSGGVEFMRQISDQNPVFEWKQSRIRFPLEIWCPAVSDETQQRESTVRVEPVIIIIRVSISIYFQYGSLFVGR